MPLGISHTHNGVFSERTAGREPCHDIRVTGMYGWHVDFSRKRGFKASKLQISNRELYQ